MQTTLRINDQLYREAKAEAAREGTTLTQFLEEGLRLRLNKKRFAGDQPYTFPVYRSGVSKGLTDEEIRRLANEDQERHDFEKLGHPDPEST